MRKCNLRKKTLRSIRVREVKLRIQERKMKKVIYSETNSAMSYFSQTNRLLNKIKKD